MKKIFNSATRFLANVFRWGLLLPLAALADLMVITGRFIGFKILVPGMRFYASVIHETQE